MDNSDEILKKQIENNLAFKKAIESGNLLEQLRELRKTFKPIKNKTDKIALAKLDENKYLKDYDYYEPIRKEFIEIYKVLNKNNIINAFSKGPRLDLEVLKNKFEKEDLNKNNEPVNKLLNTLGMQFEVDSGNNFNPKNLFENFLATGVKRLINEPKLNKKLTKLYLHDVNHIIKEIEEYSYISEKLRGINDLKLRKFVIQLLYLKAYEGNLKALMDAYTNETGKNKRSFDKPKEYYADFKSFKSKHSILTEAMDDKLRTGIAHNIYETLEMYDSEKILELARRNFITNILGVVVKTNRIIVWFDELVKFITKIGVK
jgi:hypothetical protein